MPGLISFRARRAAQPPAARRGSGGSRPRSRIGGEGSRAARGTPRPAAATALSRMAPPAPAEAELGTASSRMAPPPAMAEAELPRSTTTIDALPFEMLTEVLLRVSTPAALVNAAAVSRSWRGAVATPAFLDRYRERHTSSTFLGLYVPREFAGPPLFHIPDSIRLGGDDARHVKDAARRASDFCETRRYQDHRLHDADAFILGNLLVDRRCRFLDCHNGRLLLTRGDEALEALELRSPLARESILLPPPPDVVDPYCFQACLLHGHDKAAAAFRVVCLQHRRERRSRQARAVEYDSTRKSWQDHPWETINSTIEGTPEEVMHAGHRIFCKYTGTTPAALVLDTRNMQFSVLTLPSYQNFAIGEIEDNVTCFVEADGCADHRFKVWQLDEEKFDWDLKEDIEMDQVIGHVGYYRPRAISNGIAVVCSSTTQHHFVVDLKTCSVKEELEFHCKSAYPIHMPWPPVFSCPTANGGFDRDGLPASVGDARIGIAYRVHGGSATNAFDDGGLAKLSVGDVDSDARTGARESDGIDDPSPGPTANAAGGFDRDGGPASVGDARIGVTCRVHGGSATNAFDDGGIAKLSVGDADADAKTGARESDEIDDPSPGPTANGGFDDPSPDPSVGGCVDTNPLPEAKKVRLLHSSSVACFVPSSSTAPSALMDSMTEGSPSCPHQGKKRAGSRQSKESPKAMGLVRCNWKRKPKHLKAIDQRRRHLFSIASKISEVQIATSSCREASAASTVSVLGGSGSTLKFTDVGKQPTIDVCFTGAPGLFEPSAGESAEQRDEAAQDSNEPQDIDIQDPSATPTSATTEQSFGKDKNYVSNDCLIPDICDPFSDLMNPKGRKRADSRESKGSPEAKGPGRRNWKRPKYLEVIFDLRRRQLSSIASKISDEVQIATSRCTEESAASTAAIGSTFTDSGKQPDLDASIISAPSPFHPNGDLAEQRGEAARGKGCPEATGRRRREKKLNPKYIGGDWLFDDACPVKARAPYHRSRPPQFMPPKDTFLPSWGGRRCRFAATMAAEGKGKNPAGGGRGDNPQNQQAVLQDAPVPAVQGEVAQDAGGQGKGLEPQAEKADREDPEAIAVEDPEEDAATATLQEEMKAPVTSIPDGAGAAFTAMQLHELEQQSRVYQCMAARVPVPTHLVFPVWKSVTVASYEGAQKYPTLMGLATLCLDFGKNLEPEPWRCRRTDGKKWRCWRSTIPNEKYCERHMHRGCKRPVQVV